MTWISRHQRTLHRTAAAVAVVFGLVTVFAGGRVLRGADPGYVAFMPLLAFNTAMGVAYAAVGVAIWRDVHWSATAAGAIAGLNVLVLGAIIGVYATGGLVAVDSLRAMAFRTVVWILLYAALVWMRRDLLRIRRAVRAPVVAA